MSLVDTVKGKVQRMLTEELGSIKIDRDGDFIITHESAVVFVSVFAFNDKEDSDIVIRCTSPMIKDAPLTSELTKWVAIEGQHFSFGSCNLNPNEDGTTAWIYFRYAIVGNDLDSNELISAVYRTVFTANQLDDELKSKFGGKLFTED
jgi:hypothetical protein